jgi:SAM-dependent methyltransferase
MIEDFLKRLKIHQRHNDVKKPDIKISQHFFDFIRVLDKNGALLSRNELLAANAIVHCLELPSHHDSQKNWDLVKSLNYILKTVKPDQPIFDAGSGSHSGILSWLYLLHFNNLYAMDVRGIDPPFYKKSGIRFYKGDICHTQFPDAYFSVVTSLSVIEHGLDLDEFLQEMSRILNKNGVLILTTDYWSEPIECQGIYPYGEQMGEMKVFQPEDIKRLITLAERHHLHPIIPVDLNTEERCIKWERVNQSFTFLFIAFIRE